MDIDDHSRETVAAEFRRAALILMSGHGIPPLPLLASAHAWIMAEMAAAMGAKTAADCVRFALATLDGMAAVQSSATAEAFSTRVQ